MLSLFHKKKFLWKKQSHIKIAASALSVLFFEFKSHGILNEFFVLFLCGTCCTFNCINHCVFFNFRLILHSFPGTLKKINPDNNYILPGR